MVLKIRLARFGKRHAPFYNIVVAHARYAHDPSARPKPTIPTSVEHCTKYALILLPYTLETKRLKEGDHKF